MNQKSTPFRINESQFAGIQWKQLYILYTIHMLYYIYYIYNYILLIIYIKYQIKYYIYIYIQTSIHELPQSHYDDNNREGILFS